MSQTHDTLGDVSRRIIERLRRGCCGVNELYRDLKKYASPVTVKKRLKDLVDMGLVKWDKGRRGQKSTVRLAENLARFEEKEVALKTMWDDCFDKIRLLDESLQYGLVSSKDAGAIAIWLIYEALPLLATVLIESDLTLESRMKLSNFSANQFQSFFDKILKLREKYPQIKLGFEEGLKELRAHAGPVEDEIIAIFERMNKLKAEKESGER
jgi:DNA-binding HxlR family transcriptional regulator